MTIGGKLSVCRRQRFLVVLWAFLALEFVGVLAVSGVGHAVPLRDGEKGPGSATPILERHMDVERSRAADHPRSEGDQKLVEGWPLYRTPRGQAAFNRAMATLAATEGASPAASAFENCPRLACRMALPRIDDKGWIPAGRLWVAPERYILFVHSPRPYRGRHGRSGMEYFVLHEFHNSTRNTDLYDTISSHSGSVFVPLYMSKEAKDAKGRRFVVVVQVAPYDVRSVHASNMGSAGPGIEVAKNYTDELEPLQALAGIVVTRIVKDAAPHLDVVNHRGSEGLAMLQAYRQHLSAIKGKSKAKVIDLPFVAATKDRIAAAGMPLGHLVRRPGVSPPLAIAQRAIVPPRKPAPPVKMIEPVRQQVIAPSVATAATADAPIAVPKPVLVRQASLGMGIVAPLARPLQLVTRKVATVTIPARRDDRAAGPAAASAEASRGAPEQMRAGLIAAPAPPVPAGESRCTATGTITGYLACRQKLDGLR